MEIIDPRPLFENKTVSLVCNGASPLQNDYADEIDSSDLVLRINNGCFAYKEHTDKLGKRCDVFCLNGAYRTFGSAVNALEVTFQNYKQADLNIPVFFVSTLQPQEFLKHIYLRKEYIEASKGRKIFALPHKGFHSFQYTSGFGIVLYLLKYTKIKELRLFGMDFYKDNTYHFWDADAEKDLQAGLNIHKIIFEEFIVKYIERKSKKLIRYT